MKFSDLYMRVMKDTTECQMRIDATRKEMINNKNLRLLMQASKLQHIFISDIRLELGFSTPEKLGDACAKFSINPQGATVTLDFGIDETAHTPYLKCIYDLPYGSEISSNSRMDLFLTFFDYDKEVQQFIRQCEIERLLSLTSQDVKSEPRRFLYLINP